MIAVRFTDSVRASSELAELLRLQVRISLALLQVLNSLSPTAQVKDVIRSICSAARRALEAENVYLFLPDGGTGSLTAVSATTRELRIGPLGAASAKRALLPPLPISSTHPRFLPNVDQLIGHRTRSVLCIPLGRKRGNTSGLLVALNKRRGLFTPEDNILGKAIAKQISAVLNQASLLENIRNVKRLNEQILSSMATAVVGIEMSGNLASVNRSAATMFGFHPRKDLGKNVAKLLDRSSNPRLSELIENALRSMKRRTSYDIRLVRRDHSLSSVNATAIPMRVPKGGSRGILLVAEDLTKEQRYVGMLNRYLAREVAERLLQGKGLDRLGGTKTQVAILVADIRDFTALSEKMSPEELIELLNTYFPPMVNVIFRHKGMVDKFMGDAILAVFGVPTPAADDSLRAVQAAIEMRQELSEMNRKQRDKESFALEIGIGITSGAVISGNVGSERRMDFTVIGDPVNLASRLEGLTRELKRKILISEEIYRAVKGTVPCEYLGRYDIKGKSKRVPVYAVDPAQ